MHKSENEKIDSILDEHQQIYRRHNRIYNILAFCACIAWIPCVIAAFGVDGIYLKILFAVIACSGAVCCFLCFFTLLPESLMVLSRQSLLQLMRLTEDVPDARQELLNGMKRISGVSGWKKWMQCRRLPLVSVNRIPSGSLLKRINPNENLLCFITS